MIERRKPLRRESVKREQLRKAGLLKKPTPKAIKRSTTKEGKPKRIRARAKNNTGQMDAFREVWATRPHVCEVCPAELWPMPDDMGDREAVEAWVRQFSHLVPKGYSRRLKCDPRNIRLQCHRCHDKWHDFKDLGLRDDPAWAATFKLYDELKLIANGVQN